MLKVEKDNLSDVEQKALIIYALRESLFGPPANAEVAEARWQKCLDEACTEAIYERYEDQGNTEEAVIYAQWENVKQPKAGFRQWIGMSLGGKIRFLLTFLALIYLPAAWLISHFLPV